MGRDRRVGDTTITLSQSRMVHSGKVGETHGETL